MKNINVVYNRIGKIESVSDSSMYFEQENDALRIDAQIPADEGKLVRAYIKAAKNSEVIDVSPTAENMYSVTVGNKCMCKGTLYVGFEAYDESGYIERYEPLKVYVDSFVNVGDGSAENVYVVTVDVAEVETLEPDTPAYVENVGTKKDMRLKIGIPRGKDGEHGYSPVKGEDYFTADEQQGFKADILADIDPVLNTKADKNNGSGGFAGGEGASTNTGGAVGNNAESVTGGAIGNHAYSEQGGAVGEGASTNTGGAVGNNAESVTGGAVGNNAQSVTGGAIGNHAYSEQGGAVGENANAMMGGAVGYRATAREGGAVGNDTVAGYGFSGGNKAQVALDDDEEPIDAIQLGQGHNANPKSLQVYSYTLMNADGTIPEERLSKAKAYTDEKEAELSSAITTLENNEIECSSSGAVININDSAEAKLRGLKLYGKTTQGENPSPENPQEMNSVGDNGEIDITFSDGEQSQNVSVAVTNGLSGIPVTSGGNYTDENGQMWVCDEVDFERGVYVQRVYKYELTGKEGWGVSRIQSNLKEGFIRYDCITNLPLTFGKNSLWSHFQFRENQADYGYGAWVIGETTNTSLRIITDLTTVDELKEFLVEKAASEEPVVVLYILAEPIETPLTEEEIEAYKSLTMYKTVTNIFNSDNAHMEVDYVADTKTYIDNKFAQLQALILEG